MLAAILPSPIEAKTDRARTALEPSDVPLEERDDDIG